MLTVKFKVQGKQWVEPPPVDGVPQAPGFAVHIEPDIHGAVGVIPGGEIKLFVTDQAVYDQIDVGDPVDVTVEHSSKKKGKGK